jgi:hypothetical protein
MSASTLNTATLNPTGITRQVAGYVAATHHADLPAATVLTTKRHHRPSQPRHRQDSAGSGAAAVSRSHP